MRATLMDNTFVSEADLILVSAFTFCFFSHLLFTLVKSFRLIKRTLAFPGARPPAGACFSYFREITWHCHALIVIVSLKSRARETRLGHGTSSVTIISSRVLLGKSHGLRHRNLSRIVLDASSHTFLPC
jgi:hypothetical protein